MVHLTYPVAPRHAVQCASADGERGHVGEGVAAGSLGGGEEARHADQGAQPALRELLVEAWRLVTLRRLVRQFDGA
jgi:hypothetical protein